MMGLSRHLSSVLLVAVAAVLGAATVKASSAESLCNGNCPNACYFSNDYGEWVCPVDLTTSGSLTLEGSITDKGGTFLSTDVCYDSGDKKSVQSSTCDGSPTQIYELKAGPNPVSMSAISSCSTATNFDTVLTLVGDATCIDKSDDHEDTVCATENHAKLEDAFLDANSVAYLNVCGWGVAGASEFGAFEITIDATVTLSEKQACEAACSEGTCVYMQEEHNFLQLTNAWVCNMGDALITGEDESVFTLKGSTEYAGDLPSDFADEGECVSDKFVGHGCSGRPTVTYAFSLETDGYLAYATTCKDGTALDTQLMLSEPSSSLSARGECAQYADDASDAPAWAGEVSDRTTTGDAVSCTDLTGDGTLVRGDIKRGRMLVHVCGYGTNVGTYELQVKFVASDGGSVSGDPHFVGFNGHSYDYFGRPGATFSIISSPTFQLNGLLAPELHNGLTYLSAVGLLSADGHRVKATAVPDESMMLVTVDDVPVQVGDAAVTAGGIVVTRKRSGNVVIASEELEVEVHLHKGKFVDLSNVKLMSEAAAQAMHGVLGQTADAGQVGFEGEEADYIVSSMWSSDFKYNRFEQHAKATNSMLVVPSKGRAAKRIAASVTSVQEE